MKMTKRRQKVWISSALPIDLSIRAVTYARRMRMSEGDLIGLALDELFVSKLKEWQRAFSTIVELAAFNYLESVDDLMTGAAVSHAKQKTKAEVPPNPCRLPPDLHARCVACASYLGVSYDELLEIALRNCFDNPLMPPSMRQALVALGTMALNDYLEKRQPPRPAEADRATVARLRH